MTKRLIRNLIVILVLIALAYACGPNMFYRNAGTSESVGTTGNGTLKNAWQISYKTSNSKYFSFISYYFAGVGYVHSSLYKTLTDTYKTCESSCPGIQFRIMECSLKNGGKTLLHRSHKNGLSVDFMVPKMKDQKQVKRYDKMGLWHYLLNFDAEGRLTLNKDVVIDFETMGRHILALDDAARKNGLAISKVILKIDLKDEFYSTKSGKEVKKRGIYFARNLSEILNKVHDDHYHVDFKIIN